MRERGGGSEGVGSSWAWSPAFLSRSAKLTPTNISLAPPICWVVTFQLPTPDSFGVRRGRLAHQPVRHPAPPTQTGNRWRSPTARKLAGEGFLSRAKWLSRRSRRPVARSRLPGPRPTRPEADQCDGRPPGGPLASSDAVVTRAAMEAWRLRVASFRRSSASKASSHGDDFARSGRLSRAHPRSVVADGWPRRDAAGQGVPSRLRAARRRSRFCGCDGWRGRSRPAHHLLRDLLGHRLVGGHGESSSLCPGPGAVAPVPGSIVRKGAGP